MEFTLSDEQKLVQQTAREFARREVLPRAAQIDRRHEFPADLVKRMAELNLMGVAVPEAYGGAGFDPLAYALAIEEVSVACASTGVIMSVNNSLVCDPILQFGDEAQKQEHLIPLAKGQKLGCFALSEPQAGSDAAAQKTIARREGDSYVVNGVKNWITNGPEADICVLMAMTAPDKGHRGITAFILPMDLPGVRRGAKEDKLGITASGTCQIFLEDCRIPVSLRLGEEGQGFRVAMSTLDGGRIGIAAQALGIGRAAMEGAIAYGRERQAFGRAVTEHQAIQFMLADMATELDAARMLTWRAATLKGAGQSFSTEAAMAKLMAAEAANRAATKGLQIHGGYGYTRDYAAERHFRDAKITEIYEGTSEIQRIVIARALLRQ